VFDENFLLIFWKRLVEQDAGIHDEGSKRMIIAVLTAASVIDFLLVLLKINPEVMFVYGIALLITLILAMRGSLTPARLLIPLGGLIMFGYLMLINKGIRDIALLGLPVVVIASGLLYGKPGTLLYGLLALLTLALIGLAEADQKIPTAILIENTMTDYIATGIAIVMVAILQWLVIDRLNINIKTAQQNEKAQRLSNEALSISEARYRLLIDESPQGILILDEELRIELVNPFGCELLGYQEAELIGRLALELIDPEDLAHRPVLIDELRGERIIQRERLLMRKDDVRLPVMGSIRYMPDGRFQYIFQDISKQKQAEAERETLIRELEDKNAELEQFTYTVSHDLKSPLVTIRGFLGYLEQDVQKGDQTRIAEDIRRIEKSAERMNNLLMDLLELSRIGRLMNPAEDVSFEQVVREALELLQGRLSERSINVKIQEHLPVVFGDRSRLVEVLQNLIDNAVKFMGDQVSPMIEVGVRDHQEPLVFFVRDNGMGIAPEFHERIFGLFNRLNQNIEGTGIGLTLVKRIVEVHGGRIWVESTGDQTGSTFCFTLAENSAAFPAVA
jgi:two-component system, LuxR family, sensor kinase FixL